MNIKQLAFWATTALSGTMLLASGAQAQSTASQEFEGEAIVVTGARGGSSIGGLINAEQVLKTRSVITQEYLSSQAPGQSILQSVNLVPGVNFTNNDAFGASGGAINIRGFDGNRVSLTFDGAPLNDTGNYAIYSSQQLDPELIERANVNVGTTDVDSPTASATGGTINYVSRTPASEFGGFVQQSIGMFDYRRTMGVLDTGEIGPWGTKAWFAISSAEYDKHTGVGGMDKTQYNARFFQPLGENGDFLSLAFHYNESRNDFYRRPTLADFNNRADKGYGYDYFDTCTRDAPTPGAADNDGSGSSSNPLTPASCSNFYGLNINPSNTGNIRGQSRFTLTDALTLTVDPSFQYVLANGGGSQVIGETDGRLRGASGDGVDLNGDGDIQDVDNPLTSAFEGVRLYAPNTTATHRYGLTSSLIWDVAENHRVRASYTHDYGRHRQTGEYTYLGPDGFPDDVFGGKSGYGRPVLTDDGDPLQRRDRFSLAILNQISAEYRGEFLDDALKVTLGVRAPFFKRELNQFCYTQLGTNGTVYCTAETPTAQGLDAQGRPQFSFASQSASARYLAPYKRDVEFEDVLPNVGASYRLADNHSIYASYAEGLSAPRTDSLYSLQDVDPETTKSIDIGYRYRGKNLIGSVAAWSTKYDNRIVQAFDEETRTSVDTNVGAVDLWGVDAEVGFEVLENLTAYFSASYKQSEVKENIPTGAGPDTIPGTADDTFLATKGKELVDTPEWTYAGRVTYDIAGFTLGAQAKYVDERFSTFINDQKVDSYATLDLDLRYDLSGRGLEGTFFQLNWINVTDEQYLGVISSPQNNAGGNPLYQVGAPQTLMATLRVAY